MVCLSCAQRGPGEKDDMQRTAGHNHQGSLFASIYFGMDGEFLGGGVFKFENKCGDNHRGNRSHESLRTVTTLERELKS